MRTLYKYYSGINSNYFEKPTFKLTSSFNLNDPFEVTLENELLSILEDLNKDDESFKQFKEVLGTGNLNISYNNLLKMCGVISLSETQHNLLMWAHYADQHRGMCIGYDFNVIEEKKFKNEYKKLPIINIPRKIDYDTKKMDYHNYTPDITSSNKMINSILVKQLTTKGDDWIYEKEHRLIVPIGCADKFIYKQGRGSQAKPLPDEILRLVEETSENEYKILEDGDLIANAYADDNKYIFLLDIEKKFIKSVYLGCRMSTRMANKIKKVISDDPELSHVPVYQFKESLSRFELDIDPDLSLLRW